MGQARYNVVDKNNDVCFEGLNILLPVSQFVLIRLAVLMSVSTYIIVVTLYLPVVERTEI